MKKLIVLFLFPLALVACSSDDGQSEAQQLPVTIENLLGTWLAVEARRSNGTELGPFEPIPETSRYTITFKNDMTVVLETFMTCQGTYNLNEEIKKLTIDLVDCQQPNPAISTVTSLTNKELILVSETAIEEGGVTKYKKL